MIARALSPSYIYNVSSEKALAPMMRMLIAKVLTPEQDVPRSEGVAP
jgi:hypothetical protein